ncbi:MAG: four helix bundle protein [Candidatus Latescibacteria bacterium]|nr:four helix bundle protein [Candidatus Latescibacterota bacterium]
MAFRFENLEIWQLACNFNDKLHLITKKFPKSELFGLTSDLNRSGISIPANIAEGSGSNSAPEFKRYLGIAVKSLFESVSHMFIAKKRNYINESEFSNLYSDAELLVKKIKSFIKTIN